MEAMQVVLIVAGLAVWALLVVLGVKAAMNKGRSPHWMRETGVRVHFR